MRQTTRYGEAVTLAAEGGKSLIGFKVTGGGTGTDHVLFKSLGLADMADADYIIQISAEEGAHVHQDESTIATTGFDILLLGTAVAHVTILGRVSGSAPQ